MFVHNLSRSVDFYQELLVWDVALRDITAALLVSPAWLQLYLRDIGPNAQHPLGPVGIQYLVWTADSEDDLAGVNGSCGRRPRMSPPPQATGSRWLRGCAAQPCADLGHLSRARQGATPQIMQRIYGW